MSVIDVDERYPEDIEGLLNYYGNLHKKKIEIKNIPVGIEFYKGEFKTLLIIGKNSSKLKEILDVFPLAHYNLLGVIVDKEYNYSNFSSTEKMIKVADKILILDENVIDEAKLNQEKIIRIKKVKLPRLGLINCIGFGTKNEDKKIIVSIPRFYNGIIWNYNSMSGIVNFNEYIPIADMQNYRNHQVAPSHLGLYNPWDYYFKKLNDITLDEVYESKNVYINTSNNVTGSFDYASLSDRMISKKNALFNDMNIDKNKTLGVFLRGTDYFFTAYHPRPFDQYESIEICKQYMEYYKLDNIFLNTEDEDNYNEFKKIFGSKLCAIKRKRFSRRPLLPHSNGVVNNFNGLYNEENYILETLIMSELKFVLGSVGTSSYFISHQIKKNGGVFINCLHKNVNKMCGPTPLIVESYGKNHFMCNKNNIIENNTSVNIDDDGAIYIHGQVRAHENIKIISNAAIFLKPHTTYVYSITTVPNVDYINCNLIFSSAFKKSIQCINNQICVDDTDNYVSLTISSKKDANVNIKLYIQIEKGICPTNFEKNHVSITEIAFKSKDGICYKSDSIQKIDTINGTMEICNKKIAMDVDELRRLNDVIQFDKGYVLYKINSKQYHTLSDFIYKQSNKIEECIDYWPLKLPYHPNTKHLMKKLISSYLRCDFTRDEAVKRCMELSNDAKCAPFIANFFSNGIDIEKDIDKALEILEKNIPLESNIHEYFDAYANINTDYARSKMIELIIPSANSDNGSAMLRLGKAYRDGLGVPKDLNKAAEWMGKAANKKVWGADIELADVLKTINTENSLSEMISVLQKSIENDNGSAMLRLGKAYRDGLGVPKDLNKAAEWMGKAANKKVWGADIELASVLKKINNE